MREEFEFEGVGDEDFVCNDYECIEEEEHVDGGVGKSGVCAVGGEVVGVGVVEDEVQGGDGEVGGKKGFQAVLLDVSG